VTEKKAEFTRYREAPYTDTEPEPPREPGIVEVLPGLARIAGVSWWRGTRWSVETSVRVGVRLVRFAASGQAPADLFRESGTDLRVWLRRFFDVVDESATAAAGPSAGGTASRTQQQASVNGSVPLRERGAELLRQSTDVHFDDDCHPAYARMLEELAPDEARILRHMAREGPQAAVDIRTGGPVGIVNSQLIAAGLTMIAREAGCRRPERVHQYLDNLNRLGMIWFSRETLEDQQPYQVLEAQPEVAEAMERAGRARTVRRSIHLTPFGEDFCKAALPLDTAEIDALPTPPPDDDDDEPVDAELA
jgi:hypothetical protein